MVLVVPQGHRPPPCRESTGLSCLESRAGGQGCRAASSAPGHQGREAVPGAEPEDSPRRPGQGRGRASAAGGLPETLRPGTSSPLPGSWPWRASPPTLCTLQGNGQSQEQEELGLPSPDTEPEGHCPQEPLGTTMERGQREWPGLRVAKWGDRRRGCCPEGPRGGDPVPPGRTCAPHLGTEATGSISGHSSEGTSGYAVSWQI